MKSLNKFIRKALIVFAVIYLPFFAGCENNLSDEGISYIASDTLGTLILDSQIDTMNVYSSNFIRYLNTSTSANMLVGKYSDYESKSLLKFTGIYAGYDTTTVLSAKINLRYNKTFYQDSLGLTSFNIYGINKYYDFTTLTYDQFFNSDIGSTILGTYTGTPVDTSLISIPLDNQAALNWLKFASDTNGTGKNYGIVLLSNPNSTTIKAFTSKNYSDSYYFPSVTFVVQEPTTGKIDTLTFSTSEFTSLNYVPQINTIPGRIIVQNGIALKDIIHFDISKLPGKVIINQATLELKVDWANSFYTKGVDTRLLLHALKDSATLTNDGYNYYTTQTDSTTFTAYLNYPVQNWNYGITSNLGFLINNIYDYTNLDRYAIYGPDYPDASKRPRIKIRYSIRR